MISTTTTAKITKEKRNNFLVLVLLHSKKERTALEQKNLRVNNTSSPSFIRCKVFILYFSSNSFTLQCSIFFSICSYLYKSRSYNNRYGLLMLCLFCRHQLQTITALYVLDNQIFFFSTIFLFFVCVWNFQLHLSCALEIAHCTPRYLRVRVDERLSGHIEQP
jgi:hypothetical protein